jgi:hypothetical protein
MSFSNVFIKWSLVKDIGMELITMDGSVVQTYLTTTLARLTLIILFLEMLKFSNIISSKSRNIVKENNGYLKIFHLLK